jgi:hypothetical protein
LSKIAFSPNASGTGTFTVAAPNTNTDYTLTLPQGTGTVVANNVNSAIVSGTAVASTSGTAINFTGIPSWVKRITVMFQGVSTNGTSFVQVQIGSGSITTSGYLGSSGSTQLSGGFLAGVNASAADVRHGVMTLCSITSTAWCASGVFGLSNSGNQTFVAGSINLSGTLDRLRITTVNGTDTFDAGTVNILYE